MVRWSRRFKRGGTIASTGPSSVNRLNGIVVNDTAAAMAKRDGVATVCAITTTAATGQQAVTAYTTAATAAATGCTGCLITTDVAIEKTRAAAGVAAMDSAVTGCTSSTHWRHLI